MSNEIIVDVSMGQTRVALLEDKELVELYVESPEHQGMVGNIYRGRVESVLQGMQAAFIDIGYEKNAFLHIRDIGAEYKDGGKTNNSGKLCITDILKEGQEITVQVIKEAIGTKGPRVTTNITLPGRYLVLVTHADYVGISKRITNEQERNRLREIAKSIQPKGMGLIVRTEGEEKGIQDLMQDLNLLLKLWNNIKAAEQSAQVPSLIHKDFDLLLRSVRDLFTYSIDKFVINNREQYTRVVELTDMLSPSLTSRVEYFSKDYPVFEYYKIENKIDKSLNKKVWLKCGGYIVIDRTEALTVIDVNTGKYVGETDLEETVLKTNLEAAKEIAKQLRLRDIGGIIIIDFIDMHGQEHREKVIEALKNYLKKDKTKTTVVGITQLGLVEMTRKKVRDRLETLMQLDCPNCRGTGKVLSNEMLIRLIEREVYRVANQSIAPIIQVKIHPEASLLLSKDNKNRIKYLEKILNKEIQFKTCSSLKYDNIIAEGVDNHSNVC
ncbi:MAG: Rne/Rng family ribonuclease [Clostridiaceae bacterium]|nr:Rne/Rng family ribonuclease [Clostridiaceae bacterium]